MAGFACLPATGRGTLQRIAEHVRFGFEKALEVQRPNCQSKHRAAAKNGFAAPSDASLLAYEGIQYQYMAPGVFSNQEWDYIQEHLRILSGFYGLLRPLDGVTPYRLEMQAKLRMGEAKDLYAYWGDRLAQALLQEDDCILNLASKEYSVSISKHLPSTVRFVTCVFGEEKDGRVVEKGTMCKMARGEMVRFLAERQANDPEQAKAFDRLHYQWDPSRSDQNTLVFLRNPAQDKGRTDAW